MKRRFNFGTRLQDSDTFLLDHVSKAEPVDSKLLKQFIDYEVIYEDLRAIVELTMTIEDILTEKYFFFKFRKSALQDITRDNLDKHNDEITIYNTLLIYSMFTTIVINYAKWFTNSSGGNRVKLMSNHVYKNCSKTINDSHTQVLKLRHEYFAHSGVMKHETAWAMLWTDTNTGDEFLTVDIIKTRLPLLADIRRYRRLFNKTLNFLYNKISAIRTLTINDINEKRLKK